MGSEFRKKKIVELFKFFDNDNSNFIDKKDFEISAQYIAEQRGWQPEEDKYKEVKDAMLKVWISLQKHTDKNCDGKVSLDEWINMCDEFARNPSSPLEWQNLYCKVIFTVQDASGDGMIDKNEYSAVLQSFGHDEETAVSTFEKLAKGKCSITWEDFKELWKELFISEDSNVPGPTRYSKYLKTAIVCYFIDIKDFGISTQCAVKLRGYQPGEAKYKDLEDFSLKMYKLKEYADKNNDGKVSLAQWVGMCGNEYAKNPSSLLEFLQCKLTINFYDVGGDGAIDVDEYSDVFCTFNATKEAVSFFQKLGQGKPSITWEQYQKLWDLPMILTQPGTTYLT